MKQVTKNTEFVIGIDFGHGETSAHFYDLRTQDKMDLDILPGLKVIKSAVAILEQEGHETICVGDAAIQLAPTAKDFQVSFKKRPSEMTTDERNRMIAFMKGVYASILEQHPDYKTREHVVYIARPSQDSLWKDEESAYLSLAVEAGLPVAGIQKESRAAYFRARTQADSKIDQHVKKGVLIVDFGSSTIDFTYLNASSTSPIDDGRPLGASAVEETILKNILTNATDEPTRQFAQIYGANEDSNPYNQLLYIIRKAKEEFYANKLPIFNVKFDYDDITVSEPHQIIGRGRISIPKEELNQILGKGIEGGYIQRVKEAVIAFKNEKLKDKHIECVYLTGGASRMDFVREIFMDVFGLDEAHCPSDDYPSVIVSQGVAHLSYADIKAKEKEDDLKRIAHDAIANFDWEGSFNSIIRSSVKAKIIDRAWNIMISYRDGDIGEYLTLKKDHSPSGEYVNMQPSQGYDGYIMVRNIRSLNKKIKAEFANMTHHDFISDCESTIIQNVVSSVVNKLKSALATFEYNPTNAPTLKLSGLSAQVTSSGADELSAKFTGGSEGHIIYDAVASCWIAMGPFNLYKDRWDKDRKQHYEYYRANYADIFSSYSWEQFLKNKVSISGISLAKQQTKEYIDVLVDEYVRYAKLSMFFK